MNINNLKSIYHNGNVSNQNESLETDIKASYNFLRCLTPEAENFTFQTFDDSKGLRRQDLVRTFHAGLEAIHEDLEALNQKGAGIFVTVQETDGKGRKAENITRIRSVFADFDQGIPEDLPLKPSILVETSPRKFQAYWLVDGLNTEDFRCVMDRMVLDYGADKNAKDIARVLRVPGFHHRKGEPFQVKLIDSNGRRYSRDQVLDAFPPVQRGTTEPTKAAVNESELIDALNCIPAEDYKTWLDVGLALHHEYIGTEEGFNVWRNWSSSCPEKYDEASCRTKWASFGSKHQNPVTVGTIFYLAEQNGWSAPSPKINWPERNKDGQPVKRSQRNIKTALQQLGVRLSYDAFLGVYYCEGKSSQLSELGDQQMRKLWLDVDKLGLKVSKDYFIDVATNSAEENSSHAIREYLDGLVWDGQSRIERFFVDYCGADDTELHKAIGKLWFTAGVRRIRHPGTKFDTLVILEGKQGTGKSSVPRILAGDMYFTDNVRLGDDSKLVAEQTKGKWIVELAELVGLRKREVETVKSMLSRQTDTARMAYGRSTSNFPRQFIFMGTTNSSQYLQDPTGNRRFLPISVQTIDLDAISRDRDQFWAEAARLESQGERIQLPPHLWKAAEEAQSNRRLDEPLEERLRDLMSNICGIIPIEELYASMGLGGDRSSNRQIKHREIIKQVTADLGWSKDRKRKPKYGAQEGDNRETVYVSPNSAENDGSWWTYDSERQRFRKDSTVSEGTYLPAWETSKVGWS